MFELIPATLKSQKYAVNNIQSLSSVEMVSSTIYVCPYYDENNHDYDFPFDDKDINLSVILSIVVEIYKRNGFSNIRVTQIKRKDLEKKALLLSDTCIIALGYTSYGLSKGSTPSYMDKGMSLIDFKFYKQFNSNDLWELRMSYVSAKSYKQAIKDDKLNTFSNLLIGYAIAHEILHQYIIKAKILLTGSSGEEHYNVVSNLNMQYSSAIQYLRNSTKVAVNKTIPGIYNIHHKPELRTYFKCASKGIDLTGNNIKDREYALNLFSEEYAWYAGEFQK